jgi:hemoglobin
MINTPVATHRVTVFDALGGDAALAAAVDGLYERLGADPLLAPYFVGRDMSHLKRHLRIFLAAALGGPHIYRGRDLRTAHAPLGITAQAWDRTIGHLLAVLADLAVSPELTDQIVAHLAPLRDQIVSASDANTVAT